MRRERYRPKKKERATRRDEQKEPEESQRVTSITSSSIRWGARCNKWTVIAHNLSSKLNHFALQGALVKQFSHSNLITFSLTFFPTEMLPLTFNMDVPTDGEVRH